MKLKFYARLKEDTRFNSPYNSKREPIPKGTIVEVIEDKYMSAMRYDLYYEFYSTKDRNFYLEEL